MVSQTVEIMNESGLHARPASEFTKVASKLDCDVFIEKDGQRVNAKSILGLLSLAITKGSKLDIITDGAGEEDGLAQLVTLINNLSD